MPSWKEIQRRIQEEQARAHFQAASASDRIRREFLTELHTKTGRNVIAYYSGWLSKPGNVHASINDEDVNGFMMAVHKLDTSRGVDLLLHTPGGNMSATFAIVNYLRQKFGDDIRAIVPQIAMSAGTIIACSCRSILMTRHSQLGPTDPQIRGIPARGVIAEFERACEEVKQDPSRAAVWQAIIGQYRPAFLSQCENARDWADDFVSQQLQTIMFKGRSDARDLATKIVERLTDYAANKMHDRPIHFEECKDIGLEVSLIEEEENDLQDTILSIHHCYMNVFMNGVAIKVIENQIGAAVVKNDAAMLRELQKLQQ